MDVKNISRDEKRELIRRRIQNGSGEDKQLNFFNNPRVYFSLHIHSARIISIDVHCIININIIIIEITKKEYQYH